MSRKALLLVPPSRGVVIRDYYCSKTSQARYLHPPVDLAVQGGWLRSRGWDVHLIDATVDRLGFQQALSAVEESAPEVIFVLVGAVQWPEDRRFLEAVGERTGAKIFASGDVFMESPQRFLETLPCLSGILTNFTSDEMVRNLEGEAMTRKALHLLGDDHSVGGGDPGAAIPVPAHDLFLGHDYRYAFARRFPMATTYTQYGCPYTCSFCISGELGASVRPTENVLEEFTALREMGVREVFLQDQCFGAPQGPFDDLLDAMEGKSFGFGWWTFTRVDVVNRDLVRRMKSAGCHTVILGVESASDEILHNHRKGYGVDVIRSAFKMCEEEGLRTAATFILGLPEETKESIEETIRLSVSLSADYASFNVAVPRAGTRLRQSAVAEGLVPEDLEVMDQSGFEPTLETKGLSVDDLRLWRRRAVLRFYLRPRYIWRRLLRLKTPMELVNQAREAWMLVRNLVVR